MHQNDPKFLSLTKKIFSAGKLNHLDISDDFNLELPKDKTLDFKDFESYKQIEIAKTQAGKYKITLPYFRSYEGIGGSSIRYKDEDYINFSSYNYLNFNGHPDTICAVERSMERFGTSVSASRVVSGERELHHELERRIADFYAVEDSVVFVSGHGTNVSVISTLFVDKDLIFYDALSHNSILEGIKLSKAKSFAFKHNDVRHLDELFKLYRTKYEKVLIITEGLFSMAVSYTHLTLPTN